MSTFELLPAIDLRGGRVVRLRQGDFERETAYSDEPEVVARRFADAGARWLHLVDLDGARAGEARQVDEVRSIVAAVPGVACEVAGGLRGLPDVERAFDLGARRVVLGTTALRSPELVEELVARFTAERIVVALDVRGGQAVGEGWRRGVGGRDVVGALRELADRGVTTFEVTAVERDGQLEGPDLDLLARLIALGGGRIIASAGIASIADVVAVRELGCRGAIVGRALYEGRIDLAEAIAAVS